MDTKLQMGDHAVDGRGIPVSVSGAEEIIQRALIRLSVKKGSLARDPILGSELYKVPRYANDVRDRVAMGYIQEALSPVPEIKAEAVHCVQEEPGQLSVRIDAVIDNKSYLLEVKTD